MDSRSSMLLIAGFLVAVAGCAMCPGGACGPGRRCSDCTPPWVPTLKYMSCVDDMVVCETGKNCGLRALARYRRQCGTRLSADFGAGFVRAYIDLAEGRGPLPPNLPPSRYWSAYYRSCAGQPRVEEWFAGYHVGLEEGQQSGVSQFRRVDIRMSGCPGGVSRL